MRLTDAASIAGTRLTSAGYLIADAKAVRSGIQVYRGYEVGRPDLAEARIYRSEDEVRSPESLQSFSHAPITIDHPAEFVTASNWKDLAVGEVSTAATWDGNRISLPLILKDARAINAVMDGKRELSAGYSCELNWAPGLTKDGQAYDAYQYRIRGNHLALVDRGRAGPECRIGDSLRSATMHISDAMRQIPSELRVSFFHAKADLNDSRPESIQSGIFRMQQVVTRMKGAMGLTGHRTSLADSQTPAVAHCCEYAESLIEEARGRLRSKGY